MSKLSSSFVLFALISIVLGNSKDFDNEISAENFDFSTFESKKRLNIDELIDENLSDIRDALVIMDPAPLPNLQLLSKGSLTSGKLRNLSLLHRSGPCTVTYLDKILKMSLNIGWEDIAYDYDYYFKLLFIERRGTLKGGVNKLRIHLSLGVDFENYVISLDVFRIPDVGKLDLQLEGTFGDKLRSLIAKIIMNLAKRVIVSIVEKQAIIVLEDLVANINEHIPHHSRQFKFINYVTNVDHTK